MKRMVVTGIMAVLLCGALPVHAAEQKNSLKITPEQFDFGTVDEGAPAIATAVVENRSGVDIEITNVRTN